MSAERTVVMLRPPPAEVKGRTFQRWLRACGRKVAFETIQEAARRAALHGLFTYLCPYEDHWHLTRRTPNSDSTTEEKG